MVSYRVTVRPNRPLFSLGADTTLCRAAGNLTRTPLPGLMYSWSDGSTGSTLTVAQPGTYTRTASRLIEFEARPVLIPNILTVNGDEFNERFVVRGLPPGEWALIIYNRWGRQVFSTSAYHSEWGRNVSPACTIISYTSPGLLAPIKGGNRPLSETAPALASLGSA